MGEEEAADIVPLATGFAPADEAAWRALVAKVLQGRPFESLLARTDDGIAVEPVYPPAEPVLLGRRGAQPWQVVARIDHPDPASAGTQAVCDLEGGASGLALVFDDAPTAYGAGVAIREVADLDRVLYGVLLDGVHLRLETRRFRAVVNMLAALVEQRGLDPGLLDIALGIDPLGGFASSGRLERPWADTAAELAATSRRLSGLGYAGTHGLADGRPWHAAGASEAQELAAVVATAVAYLRADVDPARIGFALAVDADQFAGIAKIRALRRLWSAVLGECALADRPAHIHAETAWRMFTRRDPHTNLIRATIAAFAAGVGGADSVTVLPFTQALGLPDAFARRLARNLQTILIEESNLWRVADPAAGAGGIEAITEALAAKAWDIFRDIERAGGMAAAIADGRLAARVAETASARRKAVATLRRPITGTSIYPQLDDGSVATLSGPSRRPAPPAETGEAALCVAPLPSMRLAEPFEALRDAAEQMAAEGRRPLVFLANLGPVAEHSARTSWAKSLFGAGGIEAPDNAGFGSPEATAEGFRASGAAIACLCGSDATYAERAEETARALKQAGAYAVYLAGRPGEREGAFRAAGIDGFLHAGTDAVAALSAIHAILAGKEA